MFLSLPLEILLLIANQLDSNNDMLNLLLVNHFLHDLLLSQLYRRDIRATGGLALLFYSNWGYESAAQNMLAAGVNADIRGPRWDTRTALLLAISRHHTAIVKSLLDHGADPNFMDNVKHGPLETAILNDCGEDTLQMLLDYGADVNLKGYSGRTPLFTAIIAGKSTGVAFLLARGSNVHARESKEGRIPLHFAAEKAGFSDVVKMLVDAGSDVNCLTESGMSPLHKAAHARATDTVQALLDCGADVNIGTPARFNRGQTAIHYFAKGWGPSKDIIRLLIDHGADVNSRDSQQRTPLFLNVEQDHAQCQYTAELLLDHGADICARDESGCTVLHGSARQISVKMVKWLCQRGADANWSNDNGETPLFTAIESPQFRKQTPNIIDVLLKLGADPNHQNSHGQNALYPTIRRGYLVPMQVLLEHGANVHNKDREGMTPIHWCNRALMGDTLADTMSRMIGLLIRYGADVNSRNHAGQTPLGMNLLQTGNLRVRECLINAGGVE
ncbi:hypothetical protein N7448_004584 [Penicillium atrosanguineum]|uniref:Uncharacterized protein n=1 Tax=Penicillium atrosanguineum TaxID=1132637 RepID=A0A9W9H1W1_9EURO|nr:uncharacterized protein N7443_008332 [Penicillium atrosanguineum]KAJ5125256.1 hypothetical protein N7526_007433 [Penicillium atrosanguineum]KAJ5136030.1 hypothetical protein N7448_004584 [Penicillium atrosanguineum]KAJ5292379.1 hypothetical protein N7443_008332 [Penicillium atrosanguineum]KAJ5303597.1 hypothetical protein N7476_010396 [Penicillium atrosanguineum]